MISLSHPVVQLMLGAILAFSAGVVAPCGRTLATIWLTLFSTMCLSSALKVLL